MARDKTIGQFVDEVADKYFSLGMDAYTAGVKACIDVARAQVNLLDEIPKVLERFYDGLVKKHG